MKIVVNTLFDVICGIRAELLVDTKDAKFSLADVEWDSLLLSLLSSL